MRGEAIDEKLDCALYASRPTKIVNIVEFAPANASRSLSSVHLLGRFLAKPTYTARNSTLRFWT
jgi:hypothetical protein